MYKRKLSKRDFKILGQLRYKLISFTEHERIATGLSARLSYREKFYAKLQKDLEEKKLIKPYKSIFDYALRISSMAHHDLLHYIFDLQGAGGPNGIFYPSVDSSIPDPTN